MSEKKRLFKSTKLDNLSLVYKDTPHKNKKDKPKRNAFSSDPKVAAKQKKALSQYNSLYSKTHYRQFNLKLDVNKESDIIYFLDHNDLSIKPYLTDLIRQDMKINPKKYSIIPKKLRK